MKSPVVKRSIVVAGHKTSVSLEEAFWNGMKEISGLRNMTLSELVGEIDSNRQQGNLSSAIRLFVLDYFRRSADDRLLFAGGEKYLPGAPRDIAAFVRPHMLRVFPQLAGVKIDFGWGGEVTITRSRFAA